MRAVLCCAAALLAACGRTSPCSGHQFDRLRNYSLPYAGHWVVARGDTLTFPDAPAMSDRFRLHDVTLDTTTVVVPPVGEGGHGSMLRLKIVVPGPAVCGLLSKRPPPACPCTMLC